MLFLIPLNTVNVSATIDFIFGHDAKLIKYIKYSQYSLSLFPHILK